MARGMIRAFFALSLSGEMREEINDLKRQLKERPLVATKEALDQSEMSKASTLCIYDTILFAIENWSTDGQTAPDVSLCSQSILFPMVYEQVMRGNSDYYLDKFPAQNIVTINAQAQRTVLGQRNDLKNIETPTLYFKEEEVNTLVP